MTPSYHLLWDSGGDSRVQVFQNVLFPFTYKIQSYTQILWKRANFWGWKGLWTHHFIVLAFRFPPWRCCKIWTKSSANPTLAPLVVQMVKNLPAMQETRGWSLGWENPLEKEMATHSSILAQRIPWTEEPGGLWSMGSQRVRQNWARTHTRTTNSVCWWWFSHSVVSSFLQPHGL